LNVKSIDPILTSKRCIGAEHSIPVAGEQSPFIVIKNLLESLTIVATAVVVLRKGQPVFEPSTAAA
jgi:hypothetical protein